VQAFTLDLSHALCRLPILPQCPRRFYQPEHSLMRQTIMMKQLPGVDATFAGGALRGLAVACSHPDVIVGAGSSGLVGGSGERDEVRGGRKEGGGG
jgi:nephrocystin-4